MSLASDYAFQEEWFTLALEYIKPILAENHLETGVYSRPFNPDYDRYLYLDQTGSLKFFTVRFDKSLVGFAIFFLDTEIQQKDVVSATQSVNFVMKGHRGIGLAFMRFCDDILLKQGVNTIWRQSTAKLDISKIYERMGYTFVEKSYRRGNS